MSDAVPWPSPKQGFEEYSLDVEDGQATLRLFIVDGEELKLEFFGVIGWSFVPESMLSDIPSGAIRAVVKRRVGEWGLSDAREINIPEGFHLFSTFAPEIGLFGFVALEFEIDPSKVLSPD